MYILSVFFFQAEDGIRDAQESRGLGDVYKRQKQWLLRLVIPNPEYCTLYIFKECNEH